MSRYGWSPYVPVATRRARALKKMEKLRKTGLEIKPVEIEGRKIARTFWGQAWCDHLESFSDYANRLPRGRTYVRNGSVCHLDLTKGEVKAMVIGSELYKVNIAIETLPKKKWKDVKDHCAGQIGSLLELLQGKLSTNVMSVVTDRKKGLFPLSGEISLQCSCPDWAVMCKHVAAVLYGVGARLDQEPALLFLLRGVDHEELIGVEVDAAAAAGTKGTRKRIADGAVADVFGIEMSDEEIPEPRKPSPRPKKTAAQKERTAKAGAKPVAKRKAEAAGKATQLKKPTRVASNPGPVTGKTVAALRAKFGMSRLEFAGLLRVSAASVSNWERKAGALDLQSRTLEAINSAQKLTKPQAWRKFRQLR